MVLPEDLRNMTINLMAPILVNIRDLIGCQILMDHREVPLRYPAYQALMEYYSDNDAEGVGDSAGSDKKD
jgi:flagellar assembly factor FliW